MLATVSRGEAVFEFLNLGPIQASPFAAAQRAQQPSFLGLAKERPLSEGTSANGFSTQECKLLWHESDGSDRRSRAHGGPTTFLAQILSHVNDLILARALAAQLAKA